MKIVKPALLLLFLFLCFASIGGAQSVVIPLPVDETKPVRAESGPSTGNTATGAFAKITRPINSVPGGLIKLYTDGSTGSVFGWSIPENLPESHYFITSDNRVLIISSAAAGSYSIGFIASDGTGMDIDVMTIIVGDAPGPTPEPEPSPNPSPDPVSANDIISWIDQQAPQGAFLEREAAALAAAYKAAADLIQDKKIVNGSAARGTVRNVSLDCLLAISSESAERWKKTLDGVFDLIDKKTSGPDDMSGLEKCFREASEGFQRIAQSIDVQDK